MAKIMNAARPTTPPIGMSTICAAAALWLSGPVCVSIILSQVTFCFLVKEANVTGKPSIISPVRAEIVTMKVADALVVKTIKNSRKIVAQARKNIRQIQAGIS